MHGRPAAALVVVRLEHRRVDDPAERPGALVDQAGPLGDLDAGRAEQLLRLAAVVPAAKKTASPGLAPTASARPARCASERFLATGPPASPVSASSTT